MIKILSTFLTLIIFVNTLSEYQEWQDYKSKFDKHYRNTQEEAEAFDIFLTNLAKVRENQGKFRNGEASYELEINKFSDRSRRKINKSYVNGKIFGTGDSVENRFARVKNGNVSESIDWRSFGVDTQVFDERTYYEGYGWAFSTIDAVSSAYLVNNNLSVYPSAQQLMDCVEFASEEFEGFDGIQSVLFYILTNGIATQDQYTYSGSKGTCQDVDGDLGIDFAINVNDEDYMWGVVGCADCGGPVLTAIDASNLLSYKSGIITGDLCPEETRTLNHAVLVVGYDSENGTDYWIAKNTWGKEWGEDGYFRITRNANNTCGIGSAGALFSRFQAQNNTKLT